MQAEAAEQNGLKAMNHRQWRRSSRSMRILAKITNVLAQMGQAISLPLSLLIIGEYKWELPHVSATCRGWFGSHNFAGFAAWSSQPVRGIMDRALLIGIGVFTFQHS